MIPMPMSANNTQRLFTEVQNKIENTNSQDTFMLCMAANKGLGRNF